MRALALLLTACSAPPHGQGIPGVDIRVFPEDFWFGTATAGFQVDMGCPTWTDDVCVDDASDWYDWVTDPAIVDDPGLHVTGEPVDVGPGMWELFESDVELMATDGMSAYRMSLEWSRLFPDGAAEAATTVEELGPHASAAAVARYHEMFAALRAEGIEPVVTLNHYTLPRWVHDGVACHESLQCDASGWLDGERITRLIGLYAGFAAAEYGGAVDTWLTLNEPYATTLSGYLFPGEDRSSPPGVSLETDAMTAVMLHQIEGHAAMYDAVVARDGTDADGDGLAAEVGIVMNMVDIRPKDPENTDDVRGAEHADYLYHALYLDAVTSGAWDDDLDGTPDRTRPELAGRLDFIGINYYNELVVLGLPFSPVPDFPLFDIYPEFTWEPHTEGLGAVIRRASVWGLPMLVTENGTPFVEDRGVEVLEGHLGSVYAELKRGADVRGYLYWSFVDNYEWNHGFDLRFGLYELDPVAKERVPRAVRDRFAEVAKGRVLGLEPR